jgi:hypothetical protein
MSFLSNLWPKAKKPASKLKQKINLLVTLWPSFPHFERFSGDDRLSGIRLNSAMMHTDELSRELDIIARKPRRMPYYFDIKGRQMRVVEVIPDDDHLEFILNHPIYVKTPTMVLFKGGEDGAMLSEIKDNGTRLVFAGGPKYRVKVGESIHIRCPSLRVWGPLFTNAEIEKIGMVKQAGIKRWCLSYAEGQGDIDEFRSYIGDDELIVKIESKQGLTYAADHFKKTDNTSLMAARGDLFVEVNQPHDIVAAMRTIIKADSEAYVGSRLLLSIVTRPVPSCADLSDMAWLADLGYKNMMLCDELCLKEQLLAPAVNVFDAFRATY